MALTEGIVEVFSDDLKLHRHHDIDEDVVFSLRLAANVQLLYTQGQPTSNCLPNTAPNAVETWEGNPAKLSKLQQQLENNSSLSR